MSLGQRRHREMHFHVGLWLLAATTVRRAVAGDYVPRAHDHVTEEEKFCAEQMPYLVIGSGGQADNDDEAHDAEFKAYFAALSPAKDPHVEIGSKSATSTPLPELPNHPPSYSFCRPHLLRAYHRNALPGYEYGSEDCPYWAQMATPDRKFFRRLSFEHLSQFRLMEPWDPPLRFDKKESDQTFAVRSAGTTTTTSTVEEEVVSSDNGISSDEESSTSPKTSTVMLYIGAFRNGTDGMHFAAQHPELEVHFFEPSNDFFQDLVTHVAKDKGVDSTGEMKPENFKEEHDQQKRRLFFHNYGVGAKTEVLQLALGADGSTTDNAGWMQAHGHEFDKMESILIKSVDEMFRSVARLGPPKKRYEILHINCEGCEYQVLPSLSFGTLSSIPHVQYASHMMDVSMAEVHQDLAAQAAAAEAEARKVQEQKGVLESSSSISGESSTVPTSEPVEVNIDHMTLLYTLHGRKLTRTLSNMCRAHNWLSNTHRRVQGLPFIWERWVRKCHWEEVDMGEINLPPRLDSAGVSGGEGEGNEATFSAPASSSSSSTPEKQGVVLVAETKPPGVHLVDFTNEVASNLFGRRMQEKQGEQEDAEGAKLGTQGLPHSFEVFANACAMTICNNGGLTPTGQLEYYWGFTFEEDPDNGMARCFGISHNEATVEWESARGVHRERGDDQDEHGKEVSATTPSSSSRRTSRIDASPRNRVTMRFLVPPEVVSEGEFKEKSRRAKHADP
ncbi:unnamed protein product [Amoebophrya sp. A25]|nr:unnamed protein product [Amoebophrya sp. A25]|eukprot:GSA25T00000915001.1